MDERRKEREKKARLRKSSSDQKESETDGGGEKARNFTIFEHLLFERAQEQSGGKSEIIQ